MLMELGRVVQVAVGKPEQEWLGLSMLQRPRLPLSPPAPYTNQDRGYGERIKALYVSGECVDWR